ncbi:MAG: nucleotide-binding protein [Bacteroidales bacterium]
MDKLLELERLAIEYNSERRKGFRTSNVNSYTYIDLYLKWFAEAKDLFMEYFDESDKLLKDFIDYETSGNGYVLNDNFTRQYPIFQLLVEKIKNGQKKMDIVPKKKRMKTNKCFLIHGHNESLKFEVARFLEKELGIHVTILHEESNKGKTIIEKFEANSIVDFAIALWTHDDEGKAIADKDLKPRARQNVVLETGYFFGSLGRDKVIVLNEPGIELPSDYSGLIYISLKDNWKHDLIKEIEAIYE